MKIKTQHIVIGVIIIIAIIYIIRSKKKNAENDSLEILDNSQSNKVNNNTGDKIKIPVQQKYPKAVSSDFIAEIPIRKNPLPTYIEKKLNPTYSNLSSKLTI